MNSLKEYLQQEIKEEQRLMEAVSKEKVVQEKLPYKRTALDPIMSKATLDYHYGKLHKAYVDNANDDSKAVFQVAGAFLHNLFFRSWKNIENSKSCDVLKCNFGTIWV